MQTRAPLLVGRDAELTELTRALSGTRAGRGGSAFLVGEAGIGKSRLAAMATGRAFDAGMRVLRGRGSTIGPMVPFRPLTEALLSLFRGGEPFDDNELGPYRPVLGRLIPEWAAAAPPGAVSLVVLAEAVLRLLSVAGRGRGCLLVLEDLHDADAETLAVVEYLTDNLDLQPVMLLATIRGEPCAALDLARASEQRRTGTLSELRRLDRAQVRSMAASCLEIPLAEVADEVVQRLWVDSAGNPFIVEELLHGMVSNGLLVPSGDGWQVVGQLRTEVPAAVVRSIANRTDRLGPQGRMLLSVAAVLGHRFPLSVVRKVADIDDRGLLSHLHAGVAAQLVTPDEPAPDWYAFRHPLTAEALLSQLTPIDRAELSSKAADAVLELHPSLPGHWCQLVASLRLDAGEDAAAGRLFAEAGRRALRDGAAGSAITLLDKANRLLTRKLDAGIRADILESLLPALAEAGHFDRAFQLAGKLADLDGDGLDTRRRAALHTRLAKVAYLAGRPLDGVEQVTAARTLLGLDAADEDTAPVDVVAAYLELDTPRPDRLARAEALARRAVAAAERSAQPVVACEAWELLGIIAREHDIKRAMDCLEKAKQLGEKHQLPMQRAYAMMRLAGIDWLSTADTGSLEKARQEALRIGAITMAYNADAIIALHTVLGGDYDLATERIDACSESARRLQLSSIVRYALMTKATLAAHQGRRKEMDDALAEFRQWGGERSQELPLSFGLARVFCALLEENRELADRELAQALSLEAENPTTFHLAGRHGLDLLLGVLEGRFAWAEHESVMSTPAGGMRWNRHFTELAGAVLYGREGKIEQAECAMAAAQQVGGAFPMARNLGLRLVAEPAHVDGWGDPVTWLRNAEEYFHRNNVTGTASACRALLRQVGVSVQQRRVGADQVPSALRSVGVTVREYDVFRLLVERLGNKAIANRLHISPRTVEKHVASLIAKTQQPDREALSTYASAILAP
ncbi:MAG TPA: AAA family ATPase [Kutzneria sp.]|nr:AAA family ATPase [Kutzneria sp.]